MLINSEKDMLEYGEKLGAKLKALGPAEVPQVQNAINDFFADLINGKEIAKVRIVVE